MARILVVDDEQAVLKLVSKLLTSAGYSVSTAETLEAAKKIASEFLVDVLIVDKNFPGFTGFEVIAAVRAHRPDIPAIMMTAYPEPLLAPTEKLQGYLAKPFESLERVLRLVRNVLDFSRERARVFPVRAARVSAG